LETRNRTSIIESNN